MAYNSGSSVATSQAACNETNCAFQFVATANAGLYNLQSADGTVAIYVDSTGNLDGICNSPASAPVQLPFGSLVNFWVDSNNFVRVASNNANTAPNTSDAYLEGKLIPEPTPYAAQSSSNTASLQYLQANSAEQTTAVANQGSVAVNPGAAISGAEVSTIPYVGCNQFGFCQNGFSCVSILDPSANYLNGVCLQTCGYASACPNGFSCVALGTSGSQFGPFNNAYNSGACIFGMSTANSLPQ